MDAGGSEAQDDVAGGHLLAGQRLAALHGADAEAGKIIIAGRVHPRHFRRFAAD